MYGLEDIGAPPPQHLRKTGIQEVARWARSPHCDTEGVCAPLALRSWCGVPGSSGLGVGGRERGGPAGRGGGLARGQACSLLMGTDCPSFPEGHLAPGSPGSLLHENISLNLNLIQIL